MRVFAEPGYGLGDRETENLRRLSPKSRAFIIDELGHPDSHGAIRWILNQRDPEAALANAITENVYQASIDAASGVGLGDGLGRSFFKKLAKFHRKLFHMDPIHKAVFGKKKRRAAVPSPAATAASQPSGDSGSSVPNSTTDTSQYTQQTQGPVNYVQEQPQDGGDSVPTPKPAEVAPVPAPETPAPTNQSTYQTGTDETAGLPSASGYTLTVEGQTITNYPVPLSTLSSLIQSGTQPGDRFEILADGAGTGLRVRTATGFISIPDSARAQVMAMPHDQVLALLTQAASNVAAAGGPDGPAPVPASTSSGGAVGILLALAAGGAAVLSSKGRRK